MRIALDAIGGDLGLRPNLEGGFRAVQELGCELDLVGPENSIREEWSRVAGGFLPSQVHIVPAQERVGMEEDPVTGCREKENASIMVATKRVATGEADAVVSAGNSGATMVAALWNLKRLRGILRPALATPFPNVKGGTTVLLDAGANTECKPWHLLQFAMMGVIYAEQVFQVSRPSVGILSNGEEESKGNELVRATLPLLKHGGFHFYGPVEGRDILQGTVDVVVCDGFMGNVCLKMSEGVASALLQFLRDEINRHPLYKLGALLMKGGFRNLKKRLSYDEYGGAPLLGVNGISVVCHGKSNAKAIFNAIRLAKNLVEVRANELIQRALEKMDPPSDRPPEGGTALRGSYVA
ncbi:MAG: phosphate acyltransferase PlsX [Elusimicrobia bacterium]|nr:phosphate acyltransferase PlsX [Elusimicrobiota bacterium]